MANCSGVTPGGKEALDCFNQNLAKLSGPCQTAVSPTMPASPAAAPATIAAPPPAATSQTPTAAPPKVVKPATAPAAKLTPPPAAPPPPAAAAAPAVAPLTLRPIIMPERRVVITAICSGEAQRLCPGIPPIGPGRLDCLAGKAASLSSNCYDALKRISQE
jgi:hypothetical protein